MGWVSKFSEHVLRIAHFIVFGFCNKDNCKLKKKKNPPKKQLNILSTCQNSLRWEFARTKFLLKTQ